jgi:hypothetical protein
MSDLRLSDWVNIILWLLGIGGFMIVVVLLLIAWPHIVSIVSSIGAKARAEGEARRAYRQRVYDMSSAPARDVPDRPIVPPVVTVVTTAEQLIATPNNEYNGELPNNERLAFETTAKSIAAMYQKGVITNVSKAICAAYGCTVQSASKPDSTFQMALKEVNRHLPKKAVPSFRMTPEQEATREALGLNKA